MTAIEQPKTEIVPPSASALSLSAARAACSRIAPLWPLKHFVAVNPFVGLTSKPFIETCDLVQRLAPGGMQMPLDYYRAKIESGAILEDDLAAALTRCRCEVTGSWAAALDGFDIAKLQLAVKSPATVSTENEILSVAEAVDRAFNTAWAPAVIDAIAKFCAAYFDEGQSAWRLPWRDEPLLSAWRNAASLDASLEVLGLRAFRKWVARMPANPEEAFCHAMEKLGVAAPELEDFLHKELLTICGWAGYVQYRVRENGMHDRNDDSLLHLLAIRLAYDAALLARFDGPALREFWPANPAAGLAPSQVMTKFLWQLADEHAWQRELTGKIKASHQAGTVTSTERAAVQAVFCIDVRSEVLRRALEAASPNVETLGFAGFFGLPIEYIPFGQRHGSSQCPVLLTPKFKVRETLRNASPPEETSALKRQRLGKRIAYAWNSFKFSAISCFSFVEAAGLFFGPKLLRDSFAPASSGRSCRHNCGPEVEKKAVNPAGTGIALEDRVQLAFGALRNMGLTKDFARIVLLCGHGSETTNNPYASGLDCGACGGHAGDANARVGAAILNDPEVRSALVGQGIQIPADTWFLAGLHNTTTDHITLFDLENVPASHQADLVSLRQWLHTAGAQARRERATLLGLDPSAASLDEQVFARSRDWSQVRPEWGLAGNAAFIAAPRARTKDVNLQGRVFLHDYDHRTDTGSSTLELIMTAPMVVANWINLQYFASTVNNAVFGSGNKVTHNVVGTLGVCQGNGGDLQTGLPLQSVHDGRKWVHEPLRLHVYLESPRDRIDAVLQKHDGVRQLVDNGWLLVFAIEDEGRTLLRYTPGLQWEELGSNVHSHAS